MRRKIVGMLACMLAVIGLLPISTSAAPAPVLNPGVNQLITSSDDCDVTLMHGNLSTLALSQIGYKPDFVPPDVVACDETGSYVVSLMLTNDALNPNGTRKWTARRCHIAANVNFPDFGDGSCSRWEDSTGKWTQANRTPSTLVGTQLHLCGDIVPCSTNNDPANNPRRSVASPALGHGVPKSLSKGLCTVTLMHGDFGTAAFAQMKYDIATGACDVFNSFIELAAVDALGNLSTHRCTISGTSTGTGNCATWDDIGTADWHQAAFADKHIVGSTVRLCDDNVEDPCDEFYHTGF